MIAEMDMSKNKDILPKNRNPVAAGVHKRSLSCQWVHSFHMIKGILLAAGMNRMKKEIIFCRRLYEDSSQNALWRYMPVYFVKRHTEVIREKPGTDVLDPQLAYSIRFYCMGSAGMTREWLMNDNITSAETVVKMMFESMPVNMRRILFENESV